jgi:CoA:oxalate CoA-transferase
MSEEFAKPKGPFSGLLVIDLTHVLNGPFATKLVSDLGARVIKVEPPGVGDETRAWGPFSKDQSLYFSFVNRGKESVALNLKDSKDREIFLNMIRRADVLTKNFRPGVMARLGFSYEDLSKINPRLVFVSSTGFGQTGPFASYPAYDTIIQAMSGIISMTGYPDGPPTRVGTALSDICGGVFAFCGLASALYAREKTGKGSHVDVAMFDATLMFLEHGFMEVVAYGKPVNNRIGNRHPFVTPFDLFHTADNDIALCAGNDRLFGELCEVLGRPDLIGDPRFRSNQHRTENHVALKYEFEIALKKQTAAHWLQVILAAGVPVGPILNVSETAEHPQTKARNMLVDAGGVRVTGNPIKISGYEDPTTRPAAPTLDQHGDALRREFAEVQAAALDTEGHDLMVLLSEAGRQG